jgi:hypothetical protein
MNHCFLHRGDLSLLHLDALTASEPSLVQWVQILPDFGVRIPPDPSRFFRISGFGFLQAYPDPAEFGQFGLGCRRGKAPLSLLLLGSLA